MNKATYANVSYTQDNVIALEKDLYKKAQDYQSEAQLQNKQLEDKSYRYKENALAAQQSTEAKVSQINASTLQRLFDKNRTIQGNQQEKTAFMQANFKGLIIFASLGMPNASLKALIRQAAIAKAPVIIQGFYQNNLKKTMAKILRLIAPQTEDGKIDYAHIDQAKGGLMIDPTYFKMFDIKVVPSFVISKKITPCINGQTPLKKACKIAAQDYLKLSGNISVEDALRVFNQKLDSANLNIQQAQTFRHIIHFYQNNIDKAR
jgi:conjugal transfer pilus assembly protein TrbC